MKKLCLLYHELRPVQSRYSYVTPCAEFESHCELYRRVQLAQRPGLLRPEITFDDGHVSNIGFAVPILDAFGLKGRFFITAGWTGQRPGYMDWNDLRSLLVAGHSVGAHGWSHKLLTGCSSSELEQELRGAKQMLEDKLGAAITTMSLPGGRSNGRVLRACEEAGYAQIYTSVPRAEDMVQVPRTVGRLNLHGGTSVEWLERVLTPETGALTRLYRAHQVKAAAKAVLGDRLYSMVWAVVNGQEPDEADAGESAA